MTRQRTHPFGANLAFFVALLSTALALGGSLAHAVAVPRKMALSADAYFAAQQIYAGWNGLMVFISIQLTGVLAIAVIYGRQSAVMRPTLVALACLLGVLFMFWMFALPASIDTENWTSQPANWRMLRRQWENSQLVGAGLQVVAMIALIIAVLRRQETRAASTEGTLASVSASEAGGQ